MIKISPSILSADFSKLGDDIIRLDKAGSDLIHIDVMDGHFVPNITLGPPIIKALRPLTKVPFDVHLMIENPDNYIESFVDAGADIITVHIEACRHLNRTLQKIKEFGIKAAVALNPATSVSALDSIVQDADMVLIMSVNPGFGGQSFIKSSIEKIRHLRNMLNSMGLDTDIEVDGGIGLGNISEITEAGANVIVSGSACFKAPDMSQFIKSMKEKSFNS